MQEQQGNKTAGKVKWYAANKSYGFITDPINQRDYFVHYSDIISDKEFKVLFENDWVEFEPVKGAKGWKAVKVKNIPNPQGELVNAIAAGGKDDNES